MLNLEDTQVQSHKETQTSYDILVRVSTQPPVCCLTPPVRNGVNRAGRGYSFRVLRAKMLLTSHRNKHQK